MEMKIRARLSAYSKVDSISGMGVPAADASNAGAILTVDENGQYRLMSSISNEQVDNLFTEEILPDIVDKDTIDTLFKETVEDDRPIGKEEIDSLFGNGTNVEGVGTVSHSAIDSLFK
jgi:hypothetical protein